MKFTIKVQDGAIAKINNVNYLSDISKLMALELLGGKRFPGWEKLAHNTICAITGAGSFGELIDTNAPATADHVFNTISTLQAVFIRFKKDYQIPVVLENGDYSLTDVQVVVIKKTRR